MRKLTPSVPAVVAALLLQLFFSGSGLLAPSNPRILERAYKREASSQMATLRGAMQQQHDYDTPFLTDAELEDHDSMSAREIRSFLTSYDSYFSKKVQDVDGQTLDAAQVIAEASREYRINPRVLLATLEKECNGVTRTGRPPDATMRFLMGCISPSSARQQLACAAERFRAYHDQLTTKGSTVSGWQVGVPKLTQDGVRVTPATKAVAGQFTYTPYAGAKWGGNQPTVGGVYLFYATWNKFEFGARPSDTEDDHFLTLPFPADPAMQIQQAWKYTSDGDIATHKAIDYIKGTIDRSSTWQSFDVLVAADGRACKDSNFEYGWGKYIRVGHRVGDTIYETYYGHLASIESFINLTCDERSTEAILEEGIPVSRGTKIGVAGTTGTKAGIHLHFQLTKGGLPGGRKADPYDLERNRDHYPDPNGTNGKKAGPHHCWATNPPTYPKLDARLVDQSSFLVLKPDDRAIIHFDVQNTGNIKWTTGQGFLLENVGGQTLGAPSTYALENEVPPGQVTRWEILITAPEELGSYHTAWHMTHNGERFGPLMTCRVVVMTVPEGEIDFDPIALIEQWLSDLIDKIIAEINEFLENLKREVEEWLQRELEKLWREFWESLLRECCGTSALAPTILLLGAWTIHRRQQGRKDDVR